MSDSISQRDGVGQGVSPAGHHLWIILPVIIGAALAQALMRQSLPVLYPFIQDEFVLSRAQVGLITSAFSIGATAVAIPAGWLTDTLGVKRMITIALFGLAAFPLAFPLAYSFPAILALAVFIGIATSPVYPATTRAIIDWVPGRIRALAMGLKQMGVPVGGALSAALLPALAIAMGWRMAAAATGLLVLVIAIAFISLYRDAPQGKQATHKFDPAIFKTILQNRDLMITMIWGAILVGIQYIVLSYFMLFMIEEQELSPVMAGGLLAIAQVSSIISRVLWGAVSDFIFHGRRIAVLAIIGFITATWMLGASLMSVDVPRIALYLMAIVIGISTFSFHGVFVTLVGEQARAEAIGVTMGVEAMVNRASMVASPPLFGYLVDISSSYSLAWRVAAVIAVACTLFFMTFTREPQRR
ncbi:MFS transporter [Chloroflexota bacterium]